jgi:hypothetical protein
MSCRLQWALGEVVGALAGPLGEAVSALGEAVGALGEAVGALAEVVGARATREQHKDSAGRILSSLTGPAMSSGEILSGHR